MDSWHPAYRCFEADTDGLPKLLREIPETHVANFFRGLDVLSEPVRGAMIATLIGHANAYMSNILNPEENPRPNIYTVMREVSNIGVRQCHFETLPLKILKQWVGAMKSDKPGAKRLIGSEAVIPEAIAYADQFEMVGAAEMRKRLKSFFGDTFGLEAKKWVGGTWHYRSPERAVGIEINYSGNFGQQLCYRILHPKAEHMNLELMWSPGIGNWNYLHQGNFDGSLLILGKIFGFFDQALRED